MDASQSGELLYFLHQGSGVRAMFLMFLIGIQCPVVFLGSLWVFTRRGYCLFHLFFLLQCLDVSISVFLSATFIQQEPKVKLTNEPFVQTTSPFSYSCSFAFIIISLFIQFQLLLKSRSHWWQTGAVVGRWLREQRHRHSRDDPCHWVPARASTP